MAFRLAFERSHLIAPRDLPGLDAPHDDVF
jgi:hypothetical protein